MNLLVDYNSFYMSHRTSDVSSFSKSCNSATDPISGLDDDDLHSERPQLLSGRETGNSGSDDKNFSGRFGRRKTPFVNSKVDVAVALEKSVNPKEKSEFKQN